MARKFEFRKGFIKLQRLGPIKFGKQARWSIRAPESKGMWAFPYPHFDLFYAYHRYLDMAPKDLRERLPSNPKWYVNNWEEELPIDNVEIHEVEDYGEKVKRPFTRDSSGNLHEVELTGVYWQAREDWVKNVGEKILPVREFWYKGDLYTHFNQDGSVGSWTMNSDGEENDWTLMSTERLAKILKKPGSVIDFDGSYDGAGKPRLWSYSKDHLEVFIPQGRGIIRDRI